MAAARLLVFKLGAKEQLPALPDAAPMPKPPRLTASAETIGKGAVLYHTVCFSCHGLGAVSGGSIKDLRYMTAATHAAFNGIVLGGIMESVGMPSFADQIDATEADAIHAFLIATASEAWATQAQMH